MAWNNPSNPILENPGGRRDDLGGNTGILLEFRCFPWSPGPLGDLQDLSRMGEIPWDVLPWFWALGEAGWRKFEIPIFGGDLSRKSHPGALLRDVGMGRSREKKQRHIQG